MEKWWDGTASGRAYSIWNGSGSGFCRRSRRKQRQKRRCTGVLPNGKEVYNVLLIGSDRRNDSWNGKFGRHDRDVGQCRQAKKLSLTSFMRDLYADIPGYGVHKLNYAYAAGGAKTLMATLEENGTNCRSTIMRWSISRRWQRS